MTLRGDQAEAVRGRAGLGRRVECVWGSKFILGALHSRFGCGPCGLSGFASEAASAFGGVGNVTGCDFDCRRYL